MSLKINALNMNHNPAEAMNRNTLGLAKQLYTLPASVPQFKNGRDAVKGAIKPSGEVMGQGTPTSDSIPAQISNEEAILNAGAVMALKQLLGDDVIERLNEQHAPEGAETSVKSGVLHAAAGYDDPYDPSRAEPFNKRPPNTVSGLKDRLPAAGQNAASQAANFKQANPTVTPTNQGALGLKDRLVKPATQNQSLADTIATKREGFGRGFQAAQSPGPTQPLGTSAPKIDPYTGQPVSKPFDGLRGAASSAFDKTKGALRNIVTDPVSVGLAADAGNQYALNRDVQQGNLDLGTAARFLASEGTRAPNQIAGAVTGYDPNQEGIASEYFGKAVEALTPVPELAKAGRFPNQQKTTQAPSLAQGADKPAPSEKPVPAKTEQRQASAQTSPPTLKPQGINKSASYNTTGLRNDDSVQVLDWNESRFDNSGDPAQDAALQARRGALSGLRGQADVMSQYDPEIARSLDPRAASIPDELAQRTQENTSNVGLGYAKLALEKEMSNRPTPAKYGVNDGIIYQQEGAGAEAFNQGAGQNKSGAQKAWLRFFDPNTTPEQQTEISKWLQENDSRSWLDYLKKQQ